MTHDETIAWLREKTQPAWQRRLDAELDRMTDKGATLQEVEALRAWQTGELEKWLATTAGQLIRWVDEPTAPTVATH